MAATLTYRLFEEGDIPALLNLWESATEWGPLSEETFRDWYLNTPCGPCLIVVVEDENGAIAGQSVLTPARLWVGGREVKAARASAPILRPDARGGSIRSLNHPFVGLYEASVRAASAHGFSLLYMLPNPAWLGFAKWYHRFKEVVQYPCVAVGLPVETTAHNLGPDLVARAITSFGPEFSELWEAAKATLPVECGLIRGPEWLNYKHGSNLAFEVRSRFTGELAAYAAVKRDSGLLQDFIARSRADMAPALEAVMRALSDRGDGSSGSSQSIASLKAMAIPALAGTLESLGFAPVPYRFLFVWDVLDDSLTACGLTGDQWYLCPGD